MKKALLFAVALLSFSTHLTAEAPAPAPSSLDDRRKALNDLFSEYWEDGLKHAPEFASTIGDKRYNDQITDYSVRAINDRLAREQGYLMRLAAIDPTGLTDQEKTSRDLLLRNLTEDQSRPACAPMRV